VTESLRAVIIDDEEPARARLRRMLSGMDSIAIVGEAHDGASAIDAILEHRPDVVFLDVQMPNGDGFAVVEAVGVREMPAVVFVTAHDEHALRAFDARAIDYLLKPVSDDRLRDSIDRVRSRRDKVKDLGAAVDSMPSRPYLNRIVVMDGERRVPVHVDRIDWIQADRNDVWVHIGNRPFLLRRPIGVIATRLDPGRFAQVNRSTVVRLDAIQDMRAQSHGDYRVTLADGTTVVWTRRFRPRE
jgi:two-component system, LytTR family, response regulator